MNIISLSLLPSPVLYVLSVWNCLRQAFFAYRYQQVACLRESIIITVINIHYQIALSILLLYKGCFF